MSNDAIVARIKELYGTLSGDERFVVFILFALIGAVGFVVGRGLRGFQRVGGTLGLWRFPSFQNASEQRVSQVIRSHFRGPDYHLMNHVTLRMDDGTTQIDQILVSRFGVFVIETKDYGGWIFANASDKSWANVRFRQKFRFQNPIHQNFRHVLAVRSLLEFVPPDSIHSVVVFCGDAEFKTEIPSGVVTRENLVDYLKRFSTEVIPLNRLQYAVGRLETARLILSGQTDVEHIESLARRFRIKS